MFVDRQLDVLALSETKVRGTGEVEFGCVTGRVSGVERGRAREGVALILSERVLKEVIEWREVSSRLLWVKVRLGCEKWVFVSAYGPGSERSVEEREEFWDMLSDCVGSFDGSIHVVLLGDLNARVGMECTEVVGCYGVPGRNESGSRLLELCMELDMVIGNSRFKKKDIYKYTWVRVSDGQVVDRALMDYMIVRKRDVERLMDVCVRRGVGGGLSDHFLVEGLIKIEGRWKRRRSGQKREVLRVAVLNEEGKEQELREKLERLYGAIRGQPCGSVEGEWVRFRDGVNQCAREVCGVRYVGGQRRKGSEWWSEEVREAVRGKRVAYEKWLQARDAESYDGYREVRRQVKRVVREAKRNADWRWGRKLEQNFGENQKMFWKEVKRLRRDEGGREERVRDANGELLVEKGAVRRRWAEYFEGVLNVDDEREARIVPVGNGGGMPLLGERNSREIGYDEVVEARKEMKVGKAPGLDGCVVECVKKGGMVMGEWLVRLLNVCFSAGEVPSEWCDACIVPLYKGKGDKSVCGNSRGISLLSVVGKLYGRILIKRIRSATDEAIGEEQCGFRNGRGCVDQMFLVRQLCEKFLGKGKELFWAFMDLEKAYDRVDREALWQVLMFYGVGGRLLKAVKSFYVNSRACVRVGDGVSDWFAVKVGLRQGCVMSPWLFNLYMDGVVREVNARVIDQGVELVGENGGSLEVSQLLFADDTALVADTEAKLQRLVDVFGVVCERRKLRVNVGKSKVMSCARGGSGLRMNVMLNGMQLEQVDKFEYLGGQVAEEGGMEVEVTSRLGKASRVWGALGKVMRSRGLGLKAKRRLYEAIVIPSAMYGAETWGLRMNERRRLNVLEMKCLRGMLGVTRRDRIRNEEIRRRVGVNMTLPQRVDRKVLGWFGHVERMGDDRLVKKVLRADVWGVRGRGRARFGWMDGVKQALASRDVRLDEARVMALDRVRWRGVVDSV